MKTLSRLAIILVVFCVGAACAKKAAEKKILTSEDVGKNLATTLCEKYTTCQPSPDFNKEQCLQEISSGLTERLKTKADLKIEQSMMDTCAKAIASAGCDVLNSENPPQGCEFLN